MSLSYILNFAGARDGHLFARILSSDLLFTSLALIQIIILIAVSIWLYSKRNAGGIKVGLKNIALITTCFIVAAVIIFSFRPSEKRWRRVQPAAIGIVVELLRDQLGSTGPEHPTQAFNDIYRFANSGRLGKEGVDLLPLSDSKLHYPLRHDAPASSASESASLQDIILIVFETMRGQNTGFLDTESEKFGAMPRLNKRIQERGIYYPRMHSAGYPSVEGAMGMHLGILPHPQKIIFSRNVC